MDNRALIPECMSSDGSPVLFCASAVSVIQWQTCVFLLSLSRAPQLSQDATGCIQTWSLCRYVTARGSARPGRTRLRAVRRNCRALWSTSCSLSCCGRKRLSAGCEHRNTYELSPLMRAGKRTAGWISPCSEENRDNVTPSRPANRCYDAAECWSVDAP